MTQPEFKAFLETDKIQAWLGTNNREKTRGVYSSSLWRYYQNALKTEYPSIADWANTVRGQQASHENLVMKAWAHNVQNYLRTHISKVTGKLLGYSEQQILTAAVKSFLSVVVDEDAFSHDFKLEPTVEEVNRKPTKPSPHYVPIPKLLTNTFGHLSLNDWCLESN